MTQTNDDGGRLQIMCKTDAVTPRRVTRVWREKLLREYPNSALRQRLAQKLILEDVSKKTGIPTSQISRYERRGTGLRKLKPRLAGALGFKTVWEMEQPFTPPEGWPHTTH